MTAEISTGVVIPSGPQLVKSDHFVDESVECKVIGKLSGTNFDYPIVKDKVVIGRNSSHGKVDVNIGHSSYVSRKHLQITYERGRFFLICQGKNGVFVDGQFQRLGAHPMPLDKTCVIRFPSTTIKLSFSPFPTEVSSYNSVKESEVSQETVDSEAKPVLSHINFLDKSNLYDDTSSRLKNISSPPIINKHSKNIATYETRGFLSAPPSPTGTISAVNSCPSSPRSRPQHYGSHHEQVTENLNAAASAIAASVVEDNGNTEGVDSKPPYSYAQLIIQAISSATQRQLTLSGIYAHITKHYPYYRTADKGWQNSIRHNLSLNRYFVKVPRSQEESGKGSFWRVDPASERKLVEQAWRKRRQRTVPCFCAPLTSGVSTITRSAPVSPEHSNQVNPLSPLNSVHGLSSSAMHNNTHKLGEEESKIKLVQLSSRFAQSAPGSPSGHGQINQFSVPSIGGVPVPNVHSTSLETSSSVSQNSHVIPTSIWSQSIQQGIRIADKDVIHDGKNGVTDSKDNAPVEKLSVVMHAPASSSVNPGTFTSVNTSHPLLQQQHVVMVTGQSGSRGPQTIPINIGTLVSGGNPIMNPGLPFMVAGNQQLLMKRISDSNDTDVTAAKKLRADGQMDHDLPTMQK
uniref:FoxK n=1 Tax=Phallusia mammillata TaxID=59560 RepID=A0A6F9DDU5_9ASCI|nr:FoxK [Phallusia mammillata]